MKRQERPDLTNPMSNSKSKGSSNNALTMTIAVVMVLLVSVMLGMAVLLLSATQQQQQGNNNNNNLRVSTKSEILVLETQYGDIRIRLRPDLSSESIEYLHNLIGKGCTRCEFYRAEKEGIFQGALANPNVPKVQTLGKCPDGVELPKICNIKPKNPICACHGPIMVNGMVGWAGGGGGPDFFVNTHEKPATWWGPQHTVWGELQNDESFRIIQHIFTLPVKPGRLTYLQEKIPFTPKLIRE